MGEEKQEVLAVMSKVKNYIKTKSSFNVSASVAGVLSDKIKALCDNAIENAKSSKRKTVMDKDF